jgi:hypothetical protein
LRKANLVGEKQEGQKEDEDKDREAAVPGERSKLQDAHNS